MKWLGFWFIGSLLLATLLGVILAAFHISQTIIRIVIGIIDLIVYPLILVSIYYVGKNSDDEPE